MRSRFWLLNCEHGSCHGTYLISTLTVSDKRVPLCRFQSSTAKVRLPVAKPVAETTLVCLGCVHLVCVTCKEGLESEHIWKSGWSVKTGYCTYWSIFAVVILKRFTKILSADWWSDGKFPFVLRNYYCKYAPLDVTIIWCVSVSDY
jgi:hypothetical protein